MDAFSKELAGLLCSDNQVCRVMGNKIMPKLVEVLENRMYTNGGNHTEDAIFTIAIALEDSARDAVIKDINSGMYSASTFRLYKYIKESPAVKDMQEADDGVFDMFIHDYEAWKAFNK